MRSRLMLLAILSMTVGAGVASADPAPATLVVPVVGEGGVAVYCTRNLSPVAAEPMDGGGYRVGHLAPGRYMVRFELRDERIDVLAVVPEEGDVFVPPVVARGRCHSIEVIARTPPAPDGAAARPEPALDATWSLRYGRSYSAREGRRADGFRRVDRGLRRGPAAEIGRQARLR